MKKLFSFVFVILLCVASFGLTACNQPEALNETTPDNSTESDSPAELKPTDIGYEVPVYPNYVFSYEFTKGTYTYRFRVLEISMTLRDIKEINENETLTEPFHPYVYTFRAVATTDSLNAGMNFQINLASPSINFSNTATVDALGNIVWDNDVVIYRVVNSVQFWDIYG